MALPDYLKAEAGTAVVWGHPNATGVTANLSFNNLANNAGRMGVAVDLGADWDQDYAVLFWVETGTAPTDQASYELYLGSSHDNTNWPGKVDGTDSAYPATINSNKLQLGLPVSVLVATADTNTIIRQQPVIWQPPARYVAPVVLNFSAQIVRNEATPANNDSRVILVPYRTLVQDTA
jgi:hypothetical protein